MVSFVPIYTVGCGHAYRMEPGPEHTVATGHAVGTVCGGIWTVRPTNHGPNTVSHVHIVGVRPVYPGNWTCAQ